MIHLTKEQFKEEVMESGKPVLLDFYAVWCGPCQMLSPIIEEISEERKDIKVCKVNVDEEPELAQAFGVSNIPTLVVVNGGKIVARAEGYRPKEQILQLLLQ